jgi:hypothetical protein
MTRLELVALGMACSVKPHGVVLTDRCANRPSIGVPELRLAER